MADGERGAEQGWAARGAVADWGRQLVLARFKKLVPQAVMVFAVSIRSAESARGSV